MPKLVTDPVEIIRDIRTIVETHKNDSAEQSVTGKPLLVWPGLKNEKLMTRTKAKKKVKEERAEQGEAEQKPVVRVPCKLCPGCRVERCGRCPPCQELPRRRCVLRQCTQLVLAPPTTCTICGLDGWYAETSMTLVDRPLETNSLMECTVCTYVVGSPSSPSSPPPHLLPTPSTSTPGAPHL